MYIILRRARARHGDYAFPPGEFVPCTIKEIANGPVFDQNTLVVFRPSYTSGLTKMIWGGGRLDKNYPVERAL